MRDAEEVVRLLREARDERLQMPRTSKDPASRPQDVQIVLEKVRGNKRILAIAEVHYDGDGEVKQDVIRDDGIQKGNRSQVERKWRKKGVERSRGQKLLRRRRGRWRKFCISHNAELSDSLLAAIVALSVSDLQGKLRAGDGFDWDGL